MGNYFCCVTRCVKCGISYRQYQALSYGRITTNHLHCRQHRMTPGKKICQDCNLYPNYNVNCIHQFK